MPRHAKIWYGLKTLSAVTGVSGGKLLEWHAHHRFPMRQYAGEWTLTDADLEAWARGRLEAERRHRDKGQVEIVKPRLT